MAKLRIKALAADRGISLQDLAKEVGLTPTRFSRLVNNHSQVIRLSLISKLCAAMECQPSDLFVCDPNVASVLDEKGEK